MNQTREGIKSAQDRMRENLGREHGFEPMEVEGELPQDLRGTLYRNGPALSERFGHQFEHIFEADGAISAVRFADGKAQGAVRMVQTPAYLEEQEKQRLLYGGNVSWLKRMRNMMRGKIKQPMNVNVMFWQGRLFALSDGAMPFAIDPQSLEGLGEEDFEGLVLGAPSAHPHRIASRKMLVHHSVLYGRQTEVEVYAFPDDSKPYRLARVPITGVTYFHDFIATDNYIVFFLSPVRVSVWRSLLQVGGLAKMLQWRPELGTEIVVVPIDAPERVVRFQTDAFFQWHFANAYEQGGEIVVDYVRHRDFQTLAEIDKPGLAPAAQETLHRAFVNPTTKTFRSVALWDKRCEFPSVAPAQQGKQADVIWLVGQEGGREGLARVDIQAGKVTHAPVGPGQEISEPIFVPRPQARSEDDGYALMLTYDMPSHRSFVGVYDGRDITQGPIAKVWFDHHIPTTFHGTWTNA